MIKANSQIRSVFFNETQYVGMKQFIGAEAKKGWRVKTPDKEKDLIVINNLRGYNVFMYKPG